MFKPQGTTPRDHDTHDADVALLTAYLEDELGASQIELHKERRWRPVWRATMMRNGQPTELLLKGERTWLTHPYPLDYEKDMQRTLHENGVPIPAILGYCPEPAAIVMEWVRGGRDPGLIQQAIEQGSEMTEDRWQASLSYMEILARMHSIPPEKFVAAGALMPADDRAIALGNFELFHAMTGMNGISDPFIHFFAGWLRRNYPKGTSRVSFLTGDCGQFLSDGPEVTCILDVEIGHLGDPMRDLACYRGRHPIENMGDVPALFLHYEQASGQPLDYDAIAFHTVAFLCEAYYGPFFGLHDMGRGGDWVESMVQIAVIGRRAVEALAEIIGLELDDITLPPPEATPLEDLALGKLIAELGRLPESDALPDWQRNVLASIPHYLKNRGHYRQWCEAADIAETAALTGSHPANVTEADAALTRFITAAGAEQDAALTRLFHRRFLRQCLIIAGADPAPDHIALAKMEPILDRKLD
ncbi:phosphotransferase [Novosphingobium aquae]|uniref:Phosphotransferase n=1 Tax=Novosphingobium aquae TaxID=3133435 RepID=A0ABU8SAX6_9SPHN